MTKKVNILFELPQEISNVPVSQIEETIRNKAKIPWCNEIQEVTIEDIDESYKNLEKHGISGSVARNLMDLYTQ